MKFEAATLLAVEGSREQQEAAKAYLQQAASSNDAANAVAQTRAFRSGAAK